MTAPRVDRIGRWCAAWLDLVWRRAAIVLILCCVLAAIALALAVDRLTINTSTKDMLSEELPFRQADIAFKAAFWEIEEDLVVVIEGHPEEAVQDAAMALAQALEGATAIEQVFYPRGDPFFRRNGLLYESLDDLEILADRLAEAAPMLGSLAQDPTLRGLADLLREAFAHPDEIDAQALERAMAMMADSAAALAAGETRPLVWRALLADQAPPAGLHREILLVEPRLDFGSFAPADMAMATVERTFAGLDGAADLGLTLAITGEMAMVQDELDSLTKSMGLVGFLALVLVAAVLRVGLGSWRLSLALVLTLALGLSWTAGFVTLAVGSLNVISVAFAVLFIGLSVDFGIHLLLRWHEEANAQGAMAPGLHNTGQRLGAVLLLCCVSTAFGFYAFLPTSYRGLSELGLISGSAMFIALAANLTALPALAKLFRLDLSSSDHSSGWGRLADRLLGLGLRHPAAVLWLTLATVLLAVAALHWLRFDDNPLNLRDPDSASVTAFNALLDDDAFAPYAAQFVAPDLETAVTLIGEIESLPEVSEVRSIVDFLPGDQDEKLGLVEEMSFYSGALAGPGERQPALTDDQRSQAFDDLNAALDQAQGPVAEHAARLSESLARLDRGDRDGLARLEWLLLGGLPGRLAELADALEAEAFGLDDLPADVRRRWLNSDGQARLEILSEADLRAVAPRRAFVASLQARLPSVIGVSVVIVEAGREVIAAFGEALIYAFSAVLILLLLRLRSLRDSLFVLLPLMVAGLLAAAVMTLVGLPFNFANVLVIPLIFGIGVDSGIHLVLRAREHNDGLGSDGQTTHRAVLLSALTTIASFGALSLSTHPGTASMGLLLTIAIVLALLCTLVLLPALLRLFGDRRAAGRSTPAGK